MTKDELITSGNLEGYVTQSLTREEHEEVEKMMHTHPEVKAEIEKIEATLMHLASAVAPSIPARIWTNILQEINGVKKLNTGTNWTGITGWAAAIACMLGVFWLLNQNSTLNDEVRGLSTKNVVLQEKNEQVATTLDETIGLLDILRDKNYRTINLPGNQAVAPKAYAKVYLNENDNIAYLDIKGLPEAPRGQVYQAWSLIMEPLTPSSMGLLEMNSQLASSNGIFKFENLPPTEAFGITLEPEGGSESPTLSNLYILGAIGQ